METATVKEIQELTKNLGRLVVELEPKTGVEWDAMEKMQAAHKQLRSIEIEELIEREPRAGFTK